MRLTRREFVANASASAVAMAMTGRASAQSSNELRIYVGGGDWAKANIEVLLKPFEAETGIKVVPVSDWVSSVKLHTMVSSKNFTIDVMMSTATDALLSASRGVFEAIDYSIYKKEELDGFLGYCKQPFGVAASFDAFAIVYSTEKFPPGRPRPASWIDFWDVKKFPGPRVLKTGQSGVMGPWEEALLADGVAPSALYPIDIDRAFASLDRIKPHIRKWWTTGSELQQILQTKVADIAHSYTGRPTLLIDQGAPLEIVRNQAKLFWDYWCIPKGNPNARNAQKFIEFATRAERQGRLTQLFPLAPANLNAFKFIPDKLARKLVSHPEYMPHNIQPNIQWYAEVGSDGLSNTERLVQRWNRWILT